MLTSQNSASSDNEASSWASRKVAIVNGLPETLDFLATDLVPGNYDIVFIESVANAYSLIKRVQPDLVILCISLDDVQGLQVLTMLRLDGATKSIPVLTYTAECDGSESENYPDISDEGELLYARRTMSN